MPAFTLPSCENYLKVESCNGGPDLYVCLSDWFIDSTYLTNSTYRYFAWYMPGETTRYCYPIPKVPYYPVCLPENSRVVKPSWQTTTSSDMCAACEGTNGNGSGGGGGTGGGTGTGGSGGGGGGSGGGGSGGSGNGGSGGTYGYTYFPATPCADNPPDGPTEGVYVQMAKTETKKIVKWGVWCFEVDTSGDPVDPPEGSIKIGAYGKYDSCDSCLMGIPLSICPGESIPQNFRKPYVRLSDVGSITEPVIFVYQGVCVEFDPSVEAELIPTDGTTIIPPSSGGFDDCEECTSGIMGTLCDPSLKLAKKLWVRGTKITWSGTIIDRAYDTCYQFDSEAERVNRPWYAIDYTPQAHFAGGDCVACGCGEPTHTLGILWENCEATVKNDLSVWTPITRLPPSSVVKNVFGYCKWLDITKEPEYIPAGTNVRLDWYPTWSVAEDCDACAQGGGSVGPTDPVDPPDVPNCDGCPTGQHCNEFGDCVPDDVPCGDGYEPDENGNCVPVRPPDEPDPCDGCDNPVPPGNPDDPTPTDPPSKCPGCGIGGGGCWGPGCNGGGGGGGGGGNTNPPRPPCPPHTHWDSTQKKCVADETYADLRNCVTGDLLGQYVKGMPFGYVVKIGDPPNNCYQQVGSSTATTPIVASSPMYTSCSMACPVHTKCIAKWQYDCGTNAVTWLESYCTDPDTFSEPLNTWVASGDADKKNYYKVGGVCITGADCPAPPTDAPTAPDFPCCPDSPEAHCHTVVTDSGNWTTSEADTCTLTYSWTPYTCQTGSFPASGTIEIPFHHSTGYASVFQKTIPNGDRTYTVYVTLKYGLDYVYCYEVVNYFNVDVEIYDDTDSEDGSFVLYNGQCYPNMGDVGSCDPCHYGDSCYDYGENRQFPGLIATPVSGLYGGGAGSVEAAAAMVAQTREMYPGADVSVVFHYNGCCT